MDGRHEGPNSGPHRRRFAAREVGGGGGERGVRTREGRGYLQGQSWPGIWVGSQTGVTGGGGGCVCPAAVPCRPPSSSDYDLQITVVARLTAHCAVHSEVQPLMQRLTRVPSGVEKTHGTTPRYPSQHELVNENT